MVKIRFTSAFSLVAVFLGACASGSSPGNPPPAATQSPRVTLLTEAPGAATEPLPVEATALPVATSRGSNLEATDPTTVSLASGGLQFVEFFRFT